MEDRVIYYDTKAIRAAASEIRAEIRKYEKARQSIDETVNDMKVYWDDSVNQTYVTRYNKDLKQTAESVRKLMEAYAKFLDDTATAADKIVVTGNTGINGN